MKKENGRGHKRLLLLYAIRSQRPFISRYAEHDYCYVLCQYALTRLLEVVTRYSDARS